MSEMMQETYKFKVYIKDIFVHTVADANRNPIVKEPYARLWLPEW